MESSVAVVGVGQTPYRAENREQHLTEMVYEAVQRALDDGGLAIGDIDNVVSCSQDFIDGRTISNRTIPEVEGAYLKSEAKVAADGTQAVVYGALRILSGKYKTTLVVAHAKMSEGAPNLIANAMFEPLYSRQLGLDDQSAAALQARAYLHRYGLPESVMASAAEHSLQQAPDNPSAHRRERATSAEIMASPLLASPIRELMAMPVSDGAAALVLAHESVAPRLTERPVWIRGFGLSTGQYYLGDRELSGLPALEEAAWKAYRMAGIREPARDLDLIELTDYYAHQTLMTVEAMGVSEPGRGVDHIESGQAARDGSTPVNPSGGVLGGCPLCVAGLARVIECALQLQGRAGRRQAESPVTAAAQGAWGPAGQSQCVLVLGK